MWEGLQTIYGGDKNVQRAKSESLKGKFDNMKLEEGENISQYVARIKEVSAKKGAIGHIDDDTILRKLLRILLPIYAIRVSTLHELRCILGKDLTLEGLVGRLTAFELSNFDNYKLESLESTFKAKFMIKDSNENIDEGIFLGYSTRSKAYKFLNTNTNKIVESANVNFDEHTKVQDDESIKRLEEYRSFVYFYDEMPTEEEHSNPIANQ